VTFAFGVTKAPDILSGFAGHGVRKALIQ